MTLGGDDDEDVKDDEDDEDDEDDDDGSTPNAKCGSKPTCDWEAEKCYSLGIRPSMCRRSGCPKYQYCQDQWGRKNSVKPYNVSYALCCEHHPQYCRYIEELNKDSNAKASDDGGSILFAKATGNEDEKQNDDDDNDQTRNGSGLH